MRHSTVFLLSGLCCGCAQLPYTAVPHANPPHTRAVVFDIDGTLTPNVSAVFEARKDAAEAAGAFAEKGYKVIYLSTRVSWLSAGVPEWLTDNGFPDGSVHIAQTRNERNRPEVFKSEVLTSYVAHGWSLAYAYGDSSTDLAAYAAAGIPSENVFALKRRGEPDCQTGVAAACLAGWTEHLDFVYNTVSNAND